MTSSLLGTYNPHKLEKSGAAIVNMKKTQSVRGTYFKQQEASIIDTVVDIKQVKTLSKGLAPGFMS
jgi:hypothetical protein